VVIAMTVAPGMTAPLGSATWPWMPPVEAGALWEAFCGALWPYANPAKGSAGTANRANKARTMRALRASPEFKLITTNSPIQNERKIEFQPIRDNRYFCPGELCPASRALFSAPVDERTFLNRACSLLFNFLFPV
jgi:hypothetical protein